MEMTPLKDALPIRIYMTVEERMWMERIEKYPLWYRYAPERIKQCDALDYIYFSHINSLPKTFTKLFSKKIPKPDKRTRNEKGQEKHEARKCESCGR